MTLVLTEQKMPFSRVLNLKRGDAIVNHTQVEATVILSGIGRVMIPTGGKINLLRKGAELIGNWHIGMELIEGEITIVLDGVYDGKEDDGS